MIRTPQFQQNARSTTAPRRSERLNRSRDDRPRSQERGHLCHHIRCQEADMEIREAFGRFGQR